MLFRSEWIDTFKLVIEPHLAGLPQDEDVFWISMTVPQIRKGMKGHGCDISEYYIRQILDSLGFRNRSFIKDLPMREVEERDAQFCQIADVRARCEQLGLPILSIDTKKKELIGNFKRDGKELFCLMLTLIFWLHKFQFVNNRPLFVIIYSKMRH